MPDRFIASNVRLMLLHIRHARAHAEMLHDHAGDFPEGSPEWCVLGAAGASDIDLETAAEALEAAEKRFKAGIGTPAEVA